MSLLDERFHVLLLGFVIGVLLVGGLFAFVPTERAYDPGNPPASIATATGCLPPDDAEHGWVHETAAGESRLVSTNLSVVHDGDERVQATFATVGEKRYELRLDVGANPDAKGGAPACEHGYGTAVESSANLPLDFASFAVVVEGERIFETSAPDETTAHHWDLTRPYNATA